MEFQQTNILSMTGNDDFATISDLSNYVDLTTNQTIGSGAIKTFTTLPQSSAVPSTGNMLVNKTYVDGAFVTLGTAQTILGAKTFNANVRLPAGVSLILGATATGGRITHTAPHTFYDNLGGGNHYFQLGSTTQAFIDGNGIRLEANKYLNFSGGSYLLEEPSFTNLIYNVPTSFKHQFRVNGFDAVAISSDTNGTLMTFPAGTIMREYTSFDWFLYQLPSGHTLKYQVGGNEILEISSVGAIVYEALSMRDGKKLIWDQGFTNIAYLRKDTITNTFDYEVATGYKHKFMVNGTSVLNIGGSAFGLRSDNNVFILNNNFLYLDAFNDGINCDASGNMNYIAKSGVGRHQKFIGANLVSSVDIDGLVMGVSTLPSTFPKMYADYSKNNWIDGNTSSLRFNCSSSGSHTFLLNSVLLGTYNNSAFSMNVNNIALNLGSTNICSIKQDTATTAFFHTAPTGYIHRFRIGTTTRMDIIDTGLKVYQGYFTKQGSGTTTFGTNVFNNFWTGSVYQAWIDGTNVGSYTLSDYRIKESIVKARPVLERLLKIDMIEYEFKDISIFKKHGTHHGFYAHQVQELFPELDNIVSGEKDATNEAGKIQPQTICAEFGNLYLSAIQELNAKIEAQQKQIDSLLVAMAKLLSP